MSDSYPQGVRAGARVTQHLVQDGENPGARVDEPRPGDESPWMDSSRMARIQRQVEPPQQDWRA